MVTRSLCSVSLPQHSRTIIPPAMSKLLDSLDLTLGMSIAAEWYSGQLSPSEGAAAELQIRVGKR